MPNYIEILYWHFVRKGATTIYLISFHATFIFKIKSSQYGHKCEKPASVNPKVYAITIPYRLKPKTDIPIFSPISAQIIQSTSIPKATINILLMF
jgi:hypothetical protein